MDSMFKRLVLTLTLMRFSFTVYNCNFITKEDEISKYINEDKIGEDELFITFIMGNQEPIIFENEEEKLKEMIEHLEKW